MIHLFIINPAAGKCNQTETYQKTIHRICRERGLRYRVEISQAPGNCQTIAREAAQSGEEYRIYSCGGDGTLNEVIAGCAGFPNVAVTMFAGGSGNDFIRIFNETEPFHQLERLLDSEVADFDLISCNNEYCANICSVGLDARIGTNVASFKRLPLLHGFRAYAASALVNVIRGIGEHYVVKVNGETVDEKLTLVCACNGRFYGGGFNPVPEADPADGKLEVLMVKNVSRMKVASAISRYKNGQYSQFPEIIRHVTAEHLQILCDKPTPINLDGELRESTTLDIRVVPGKLRFFFPRGLTWRNSSPIT